jgi:hypothetical protein
MICTLLLLLTLHIYGLSNEPEDTVLQSDEPEDVEFDGDDVEHNIDASVIDESEESNLEGESEETVSGGCNAGYGGFALALLGVVPFVLGRRVRA